MNIEILQLIDGAKQARGLTVIIDVFRAFSLEAYLMSKGAKMIIPAASEKTAYAMKEKNPDYVLMGERGGQNYRGLIMETRLLKSRKLILQIR